MNKAGRSVEKGRTFWIPLTIRTYVVQKIKFQGKASEPNPAPFDVKGECIFCPKQTIEFP